MPALGGETCSVVSEVVQALVPVLLALVTGWLGLLARRQRRTEEHVADVSDRLGHADEVAEFLRNRRNGV